MKITQSKIAFAIMIVGFILMMLSFILKTNNVFKTTSPFIGMLFTGLAAAIGGAVYWSYDNKSRR